jgi:transposase
LITDGAEILAYLETQLTNGITEGFNVLIGKKRGRGGGD